MVNFNSSGIGKPLNGIEPKIVRKNPSKTNVPKVIAAALPEVQLDLAVEAEDLSDVRHLPHSGHHLQHALRCPVFLQRREIVLKITIEICIYHQWS